ncbi:MAG: MBL fold metallo-hydrolase [Clostridia bacterium]|nr:MBL fold metallo-hydrolase [Clostridia bacterium]
MSDLRVFCLKGTVPQMYQAGYVVAKEGKALCIDAAFAPTQLKALLESEGLVASSLLLTHAHFDHSVQVVPLQKELGLRVYGSEHANMMVTSGAWMGFRRMQPWQIEDTLHHGEELEIDGFHVRVLATPGHTVDSLCFVVDDRLLFTGDTILPPTHGRTDLPTGDFAALVESARRLTTLPDSLAVLAGHADTFGLLDLASLPTLGSQKRRNDLFYYR